MIRKMLAVAALAVGLMLTAAPAASAHPYWECHLWHGTDYCDADAALHRATERKEAEKARDCRAGWADRRTNCEGQA